MRSSKALHSTERKASEVCRLTLPIDVGPLSPNVRAHWSVKRKRARSIEKTCFAIWHEAGKPRADGPVIVTITFRRSRKMDRDNALACCKAPIDSIFKGRVTPDDGPDYVTFNPVVQIVGKQYRERPEVEFLVEEL